MPSQHDDGRDKDKGKGGPPDQPAAKTEDSETEDQEGLELEIIPPGQPGAISEGLPEEEIDLIEIVREKERVLDLEQRLRDEREMDIELDL